MPDTTNRQNEITERLKELHAALTPLLEECRRLEAERDALKSPFKIGDVIVWGRPKEYRGRVTAILNGGRWWKVQKIKKDGTSGADRKVYDWDRPELEAARP